MKIGIVGLGLIGGSFAKAYKSAGSHTVYGCDTDARILDFALLDGAVDQELAAGVRFTAALRISGGSDCIFEKCRAASFTENGRH